MEGMENNSGQGELAPVPKEIDKWNWGAFLLHWIWGVGNGTYIALLMFIPFAGFIMPFVLGAKGSAWAWRNKRWDSVEHFRRVQRKWALWGFVSWLAMIALFVLAIMAIVASMKSSDAYKLAMATLNASNQAVALLGAPIEAGVPSGNMHISGASGTADMSFSVEGSQRNGTVYFQATKELGQWRIDRAVLEIEDTQERVDITPGETLN